jgi:LPXTG-motif cell wall-anchored protein
MAQTAPRLAQTGGASPLPLLLAALLLLTTGAGALIRRASTR